VLNKVDSVRPYLRSSLVPGLAEALAKNKPNKDLLGLKEIKLFEIGTVWSAGKETIMIGTVTEKEKASEKIFAPANSAGYGELPVSTAARFEHFSKYPYIVRDIAMWALVDTDAEKIIRTESGTLAVKISLFDRFEKGGKISLAYRIIFQSFDRTLTEVEVNEIMGKVSSALKAQGFEIR